MFGLKNSSERTKRLLFRGPDIEEGEDGNTVGLASILASISVMYGHKTLEHNLGVFSMPKGVSMKSPVT